MGIVLLLLREVYRSMEGSLLGKESCGFHFAPDRRCDCLSGLELRSRGMWPSGEQTAPSLGKFTMTLYCVLFVTGTASPTRCSISCIRGRLDEGG